MSRAHLIPIGEKAKGKWPSILPQLGVAKEFLTGRHCPCPMCGGSDRFRFDNKTGGGGWICSQCGAGDGVELVKRVNNWEFRQAAQEIEKHVGSAPVVPIRQGRDPSEVKAEMNDIWRGGKALEDVEATALYWARRVGDIPRCSDLRAVRSLRCPGQGSHAGMVALVRDPAGKPCNLHRTYLSEAGFKADFPEPRRVMDISLPKGSAVRLADYHETLGIAEGIETAISCQKLFGIPTWAALNAENLKGFVPPKEGLQIIVFGDNDKSLTGHEAAYTLARKLRAKGWSAEVRIPEIEGQDWNDVLLDRLAAGGRERMKEHAA